MGRETGDTHTEAQGIDIESLAAARRDLHRVAAHVLGRRRHQVTGRFGLRATPGGFGTPSFGDGADGPEVLRVTSRYLVRETGGTAAYRELSGASLRDLAAFAGTDLSTDFSAGADTPDLGDIDAPLHLPESAVEVVAGWYALGWTALDAVISGAAETAAPPSTIQIWPEHFDAGTSVVLPAGTGVNLGASPGDSFSPEPYLYVGPHGTDRPGDPQYWNVPFGALLTRSDLLRRSPGQSGETIQAAVRFLEAGLRLLQGV